MTKFNTDHLDFSTCKGRKVNGKFGSDDIISDSGVMLLGLMDKKIKLTKRLAQAIHDPRVKKI